MTAISVKARNELQNLMDEAVQHRGEPHGDKTVEQIEKKRNQFVREILRDAGLPVSDYYHPVEYYHDFENIGKEDGWLDHDTYGAYSNRHHKILINGSAHPDAISLLFTVAHEATHLLQDIHKHFTGMANVKENWHPEVALARAYSIVSGDYFSISCDPTHYLRTIAKDPFLAGHAAKLMEADDNSGYVKEEELLTEWHANFRATQILSDAIDTTKLSEAEKDALRECADYSIEMIEATDIAKKARYISSPLLCARNEGTLRCLSSIALDTEKDVYAKIQICDFCKEHGLTILSAETVKQLTGAKAKSCDYYSDIYAWLQKNLPLLPADKRSNICVDLEHKCIVMNDGIETAKVILAEAASRGRTVDMDLDHLVNGGNPCRPPDAYVPGEDDIEWDE